MKKDKLNLYLLICIACIVITGIVNIYGYFHLPDTVATKIRLSGELKNRVSTPVYLMISFIIITLISLMTMFREKEQKIKALAAEIILVAVNIIMIVIQLK